jgi:hypothetical protein
MIAKTVIVHLDNFTALVQGIVVSLKVEGVIVRIANDKLYFYPMSRVSGVEEV